jgi:hypothetical protein
MDKTKKQSISMALSMAADKKKKAKKSKNPMDESKKHETTESKAELKREASGKED